MRALQFLCLIIFPVAYCCVNLPLPAMAAQAQKSRQEVLAAASAGLSPFLHAILPGDLAHFNFDSAHDLQRATLGAPFRIHTLDPMIILDFDDSLPLADLVRPTDAWLVPVMVDGRARTLLTVDKIGDSWQAVAIGASALAVEWETLGKTYPRTQGHVLTFVRVYQAVSDFALLVQPKEEEFMIPLRSASMILGMPQGTTQAPKKVIENLREPVRMNLELNGSHQQSPSIHRGLPNK